MSPFVGVALNWAVGLSMLHKRFWRAYFTERSVPPYPCPKCDGGMLQLTKPLLLERESPNWELRAENPAAPDPMSYEGRFAAILSCTRCKETVATSGFSWQELEPDDEGDTLQVDLYEPLCFSPPLPIIKIPRQAPPQIKGRAETAFRLFWPHPPAAAGALRTLVEELLTHLRIPRFQKGKRIPLTLHHRIERYRSANRELANLMEAAKWLGNDGSHAEGLDRESVLDAFALVEVMLHELFTPRSDAIRQLARRINRAKGVPGPNKPKRRPGKRGTK